MTQSLKKVYFIGVGGIGMSALAKLFAHEKKEVVGSDTGFADKEGLAKAGVKVLDGYEAVRIDRTIDAIVYTLATPDDNAELLKARELGLPVFSYGEMLGVVSKERNTIAVAGTHGKTTTTAMIAHMMIQAGVSPSVIVGSLMKDPSDKAVRTNFIAGTSEYLVTESCEYKKSFLNIWPQIICITNIDADHLDFYGSLDNIIKAFKEFIAKLPSGGIVIADLTDPNSLKAAGNCDRKVVDSSEFFDPQLKLLIPGPHNRRNAAVALALATILGIDQAIAKEALSTFPGTWRRFEYKGKTKGGGLLYDDYAHHPHEIAVTLQGARELFPDRHISVIFEPHLYSRTKEHFDAFAHVLARFDRAYLTDIYAAREKFDGTISSGLLSEAIRKENPHVVYEKNYADLAEAVKRDAKDGEVIITMGAGDITKLCDMLIDGSR